MVCHKKNCHKTKYVAYNVALKNPNYAEYIIQSFL